MHEWNMWSGGGMWLGPLWMIAWLGALVAIIVVLFRWLGRAERSPRRASDILDDRYARGEIDREEYT